MPLESNPNLSRLEDFRARIVRARQLRAEGDFEGAAAVDPTADELRAALSLAHTLRQEVLATKASRGAAPVAAPRMSFADFLTTPTKGS